MKVYRAAWLVAALLGSAAIGAAIESTGITQMKGTGYLKLQEPMLLAAEGQERYFHVLPAGTALYHDQSYPEGFDRYRIYVNIKGSFAAESVSSDKVNLVDPLWARTVKKEDVQLMLADTPVSKDDLVRILKARKITREELAQILRDWHE